jgi:hypothetical protein
MLRSMCGWHYPREEFYVNGTGGRQAGSDIVALISGGTRAWDLPRLVRVAEDTLSRQSR